MTADLAGVRIGGGERVIQGRLRLGAHPGVNGGEILGGSKPLRLQPMPEIRDRVVIGSFQ